MAVVMIAGNRRRWSKQSAERWAILLSFFVIFCVPCWADDTANNAEVVKRYEQILERAPMEGPSFDKLVQIYQEGDGLEKLDARWAPLAKQSGAKGATYSLLRGLLADRMGKTDDARHDLQAATTGAPNDFHGWLALGDFEVRQGKWADAITALQKGLATPVTGEDRLAFYRKLGQAQERNLDVPGALATWQKMVEEFPKDAFALEEAGSAELDADQFDEAKKTFQKLVDLAEPNSMNRVKALMRLAEVDDRQGKTDAAVHDYEAILPLTADSSWLNRELRAQIEQIYRRQDDLAGLAAYYQKWTKDNPKDVEALLLLSGTLTELGKKDDALGVMRQVTVLAPDRHEVRQSFAQALVEAKQYDEAITVLTALTSDDPTEPRYWDTLGDALWKKTQPATPETKKAVLDAWAHIAPADSKDVSAILQVADLCREHGLNDEALAGYERALALTPDASDIREKAVKLLVDLKRPDDAWKLLEQMTDGSLATAANYLKLTTLELQFDRKDAAMDAVTKGLALEPNNFDLLSQQWSLLASAQKWNDCVALFDKLVAASPNPYFVDQLEMRQIQALTSAGKLNETADALHAKLGAIPGLTEGELRLLLRIMIQQTSPDISKALDEAHKRFPDSPSLARIEIDYNRHAGNSDLAVTALQRLITTVPAQKGEWLGEIVQVRRDQGNLPEALKAAAQVIAASPSSADGYLLYADIAIAAGKSDDAVSKLLAAIKLSDKPNDIRQRLARYYLESGQAGKARTIYDEAFEAAETPEDKLAIVKAMTPAYFQDGQIDQLISRFQKEQASEEGGWRYGLYLSAIEEQMEDYGAARRELAKSLAVRPQDTALLHSLIGLADKEGDAASLLKYREALATADPSATNEIALANEYATQGKPDAAWQIVQKNLGEVVKDPLAWKDILTQISDPEYAAKIKGVLMQAIRAKGDSFAGEFALAQFEMEQGDLEGAKSTLWGILAQPLPTTPTPPPAPPTRPPGSVVYGYSLYQGPLFQRSSQSYMALNEAQQLLASSQNRNQLRARMGMMRSVYGRMGVSTRLDPATIKDHALVYLSLMAVQQRQATEFLAQLIAKFAEWHWPLSERLVAYSLIQARDPLLLAIEEEAQSATPSPELDGYCFLACQQFTAQANAGDDVIKRATAAQTILSQRLEKDPHFKNMVAMMQINRLAADNSPDAVAKKKAAVADYMKTVDRKNVDELIGAIGICSQVGDWDEIKKAVDDLAATDRSKWGLMTAQQLGFLPISILQQFSTKKDPMPKETIPVILNLMRLGYPTTPPAAALPGAAPVQGFGARGFYNPTAFPPPNRYFGADRVGLLEPMFQQLKARNVMPDMYAALDQEEKDLKDWRKIYPGLLRVYFQWWDGKRDDAIASVRKILDQDSSDDFRLLLASMLTMQQKYDDAIPVLESVSARYGPDYIHTQMQLLHVARLAKKNDDGQKAGMRLLALRLPQQEQMQILDDLRNVGLGSKADEIMAKQNTSQMGGGANQIFQATNQLMQKLNEASNKNDATTAIDLAHQVLNRDPMVSSPYGNINGLLRTQALNVLKKFDKLNGYTQDVETQLQATPDSVRLNWLAAEAYQAMDDRSEVSVEAGGVPIWLKLARKDDVITGSTSADGQTWKEVVSHVLVMGPDARIGLMSEATAAPANTSNWTDIKVTPAQANAAAPTTNPPAPTMAAVSLPAPWEYIELGDVATAGHADLSGTGLKLSSPLQGPKNDLRALAYVYQTIQGDGEIMARLMDGPTTGNLAKVGLSIRSRLDPKSPRMAFYVSLNQVYCSTFTNAPERSLKYYKRVAELDPKNQAVLVTIAEQLRRSNRASDAVDIYSAILKSDFPSAMAQSNNVLQAFESANRLPDLVKIVQDWNPPPQTPMVGGGTDMYYALMQAGNALRQEKHVAEAEQFYRKALSIDTIQSKQDAVVNLVQILIDQNRRDDAGVEIEKWLLNMNGTATAAPPPILGFNVQTQNQSNWLQFMSTNQYGVNVPSIVRFLELAYDLGLSTKLQQELSDRANKAGTSTTGQVNLDRATSILFAIVCRDPSYRPEIEKLLKDYPVTALGMGNNSNALMILAAELERWPQERSMALQLASTVYHATSRSQNSYFKNIAGYQMLRIAREMGDHKTTQSTLREIAQTIREQRATNVNQVQFDQVLMIARWMIQEGMLKEADDVLTDAKSDPQVANNKIYYQQKIEQVQNELSFAKGETSPVALNYGLTTKTQKNGEKGLEVFWQINAGEKLQKSNSPYVSNASWIEAAPPRPTDYKLDLAGGPDETHLTSFATLDKIETRGQAPIKTPAGVNVVRASVISKQVAAPAANSTPPAPSAPPAPAAPIALGQIIYVGGPENLVKNPDFQATKDASGKMSIANWHGLFYAGVTQEAGGPLSAAGYQSFESANSGFGGESEITSDPITIAPDKSYILGCWMRTSGTLGIRFRDATGAVVNTNQVGTGGLEDRWRWCSFVLGQRVGNGAGSWFIPSKTATVEIFLRPNQGLDLAGLSLRPWPASDATDKPKPPENK